MNRNLRICFILIALALSYTYAAIEDLRDKQSMLREKIDRANRDIRYWLPEVTCEDCHRPNKKVFDRKRVLK